MAIDIAQFSAADLAQLYAHMKTVEKEEREERAAERVRARGFLSTFVGMVADDFTHRTFKSGAEGWSFAGKDIPVTVTGGPEGVTRKARVSVLIRWEDTIPAGDTSGSEPVED